MKKLEGKVAVVTGASKGIGAGIAKALGEEGAKVVVAYGSDREGAEAVAKSIGGRAVQADMAKEADVKRLFATTKELFGRVDILVNNAGVYRFAPLAQVTADDFHQQVDINVLGPLLAAREALPLFPAEGGSIINVGTAGTESSPANAVVYIASKMALNGITGVLANELGPRNIRVNSLNPGPTATPGTKDLAEAEFFKQMIAQTPLGRVGQPKDIGAIAVFLASNDSAWLTGDVLVASGGLR